MEKKFIKKHLLNLINNEIKPDYEKELGECVFSIYGIILRKHDWGNYVGLFIDLDCEKQISNKIEREIIKDIKEITSFLGLDNDLVEVYLNKRPLGPIEENKKPYIEKTKGNISERTFNHNTDSGEFVWHRDREDRIVKVLSGNNWKLQLDNQIPVNLKEGKEYFIPKGEWHRVIKGNDHLKIKIIKLD